MTEVEQIMADTGMDRMQAVNHLRGREILRLRQASPNVRMLPQKDAGHLPLFVTANEPSLF